MAACGWAMVDSLLAETGYAVPEAQLSQLADQIEHLDSLVGSGLEFLPDTVHSNPSDISGWIVSLIEQTLPQGSSSSTTSNTGAALEAVPPVVFSSSPGNTASHGITAATSPNGAIATTLPPQMIHTPAVADDEQEVNGLRLVHLLFACADCLAKGEEAADLGRAAALLAETRTLLQSMGDTAGAMGRVAHYFIEGLSRRMRSQGGDDEQLLGKEQAEDDDDPIRSPYWHFYHTCPFLMFGHFTANQAMLEEMEDEKAVHIIDFELGLGLQWPPLIQMLAIRPGGPPYIRLTAIAPDHHLHLQIQQTGTELAEFAKNVGVDLEFHLVTAINDVLVRPGETLAVNSMLHLHRLVDETLDTVLMLVRRLAPKIFTMLEQDASHNSPYFHTRFHECLHYYSSIFDSIYQQPQHGQGEEAVRASEAHLGKEIINILACEGRARVERHQRLQQWSQRLCRMGFRPRHLGSNAYIQAATLLTIVPGGGHTIQETAGCLTLGWHSMTLFAASAWCC